jgi:hypothetical protein
MDESLEGLTFIEGKIDNIRFLSIVVGEDISEI